jgi:hypothetical protein
MNIIYKVLDWFRSSCGVIVIRSVLMYYAIEIDSSFSFSGSSRDLLGVSSGCLPIVFYVDRFSLFIVGVPPHRI